MPTPVVGLNSAQITEVAAGAFFMVARASDGTAWSWGSNSPGQLGNGSSVDSSTSAGQIATLAGVTKVAVGNSFAVAVINNATVWSWGLNTKGQLGNESTTSSAVPIQVQSAELTVTGVTFGGLPGTDLSAPTNNQFTVVTPAHAEGPVDVVVTTQYADGTVGPIRSYPGGFTYLVPPMITTLLLPDGTLQTPYQARFEATGSGPIAWALTSGSLPPGLVLNPDTGVITGTPTVSGTFSFTVRAANVVGSDERGYRIIVQEAPVTPTVIPLTPEPSVTQGTVDEPSPTTGELPITGAGTTPFLWIAGLLIVLGSAGCLLSRRYGGRSGTHS